MISCVGRKAAERWNLPSRVPAVKPLFKALDGAAVCFIYLWWCVMYCWRQRSRLLWLRANCHLRQLRLPGSHTVKTPREHRGHTQWQTQTHTNTHTASHTHTHTCTFTHTHCVYLFFPSLSLVLHEWQSYFLHRLAYYSIKPLIGLDSSYLSPLEYGSL